MQNSSACCFYRGILCALCANNTFAPQSRGRIFRKAERAAAGSELDDLEHVVLALTHGLEFLDGVLGDREI